MKYISTRDNSVKVSAAQAITQGISRESGLFVPEELPKLTLDSIKNLSEKDYMGRAAEILGSFLADFSPEEVEACVKKAYSGGKFAAEEIAPISKLSPDIYMLELWHGPTCAFKDMALQILPHLLTVSAKKAGVEKEICILVATSGDTGKAALEGFKDVDGTKILVFYPSGGVSKVQYMQMATQEGANVGVCGVEGNFDDTQTAVKKIFTDDKIRDLLSENKIMFSSANSINWGRLVPQIVYHISAYCDLVANGEIELGDKINICVPTGNFGNILAAYYAKKMGLPVNKLICASNKNNVLTDFINTGVYNRNREFFLTASPSMDILISSNLERLLYDLYDKDDKMVADLMEELTEKGAYTISSDIKQKLAEEFACGFCDEEKTLETVKATFDKFSYLCDTHTAVALGVYNDYRKATGDETKTVIASTANPYKFANHILEALTGEKSAEDEFVQIEKINELSGLDVPEQIAGLSEMTVRFADNCKKEDMQTVVLKSLGI